MLHDQYLRTFMITMRDFMETVDYRITEGSEYGWACYGPNAYQLDSWNGDQDGHSIGIVFDIVTQVIYQMEAHDYKNNRAYRWFHPDFKKKYEAETKKRMIDQDEAWDDVKYTELDVVEDMLEKARAIVDSRDYDTRVRIPIELSDQELMVLFKMAHERDMTFNDFVEEVLTEALKDFERNPEGAKSRYKRSIEPHGY